MMIYFPLLQCLRSLFLPALVLLSSASLALAAGPGASNDFDGRRVLIFGIDGLRSDCLVFADTPNFDALMAEGITTLDAQAGGELGGDTQQPTMSGPGWSTLLTGVYKNKHGVTGNGFNGRNFTNYPHFFARVKGFAPTSRTGSFVDWPEIDNFIVQDSGGDAIVDVRKVKRDGSYATNDLLLRDDCVNFIANDDPDVIFTYAADPDGQGHGSGFSTSNPNYIQAIERCDLILGDLMAAIEARPQYEQEDWLIIVTTDHGGVGTAHGGQAEVVRRIPLIVSGGAVAAGILTEDQPMQGEVVHIALAHLGIPIEAAWGLEPASFALDPILIGRRAAEAIQLEWIPMLRGFDQLTSIEILREGNLVATLPGTARSWLDSGAPSSTEAVNYTLRLIGSTTLERTLSLAPVEPTDPLADFPELAIWLPFDNSLAAGPGTSVSATAVGPNPAHYVNDGRFGQAADFANNASNGTSPSDWFASLGNQDALFESSFALSVWLRTTANRSSDEVILGNKDWTKGGNVGWAISNLKGKNLNFNAPNGGRRDLGITFATGDWQQVIVSFDRERNEVRSYLDGVLLGTQTISPSSSASFAAGLNFLVGSSGNGKYAGVAQVDELAIYSGALNAEMVHYLSNGGNARLPNEGANYDPYEVIYRVWQEQHFSASQLADPTISGPDADPDRDGISNLGEFSLGTDPLVASEEAQLQVKRNQAGELILSWSQPDGGSGSNGSNYQVGPVRWRVESGTDLALGDWTGISELISAENDPQFDSGGSHRPQLVLDSDDPQRFFRLIVEWAQ